MSERVRFKAGGQDRYRASPIWVVRPLRAAARRDLPLDGPRVAKGDEMPRYLVERTFPDGLSIPVDAEGAEICLGVVDRNADDGVTWVHSYVSDDQTEELLRLRRPDSRGDPPHGAAQRAAGRPHHQGERPRPVLLPPRGLSRPSGPGRAFFPSCARRGRRLVPTAPCQAAWKGQASRHVRGLSPRSCTAEIPGERPRPCRERGTVTACRLRIAPARPGPPAVDRAARQGRRLD